CCCHSPCKLNCLPILDLVRERPGRTENRHLSVLGKRRKELEGISQLAHCRLENPDVASMFDIFEELERVFDDVFNQIGIVPATLQRDELLDTPFEFQINCRFVHFPSNLGCPHLECNCSTDYA